MGKWGNEGNGENGDLGMGMGGPPPKLPHPHFPQMGKWGGMGKGLTIGEGDGGTSPHPHFPNVQP